MNFNAFQTFVTPVTGVTLWRLLRARMPVGARRHRCVTSVTRVTLLFFKSNFKKIDCNDGRNAIATACHMGA